VEVNVGLHEAIDVELAVGHLRDRGECQCPECPELFTIQLTDRNVSDAKVEQRRARRRSLPEANDTR
jgi:hypothetical protein